MDPKSGGSSTIGAEFLSMTGDNDDNGYGSTVAAGAPRVGQDFDNLQLILNTADDNDMSSSSSHHHPTNVIPTTSNFNVQSTREQSSASLSSEHHQQQPQPELPICQSYSDIDESIDVRSPKRNAFLAWFSRRFILPSTASPSAPILPTSHQPETLWSLNYREAAIYLEEGYNNDKFDYHPQAYGKLPAYLAVHNHIYYLIDLVACLLVLSLAIFERPAVDGYHLSESIHASMELFGLAVIGAIFWIKYHWMGGRYFLAHKRTMIKTIVLILMITEAIVVLLRRDSHFRVTRSLRPVFLIDNFYFGGVRRVIRQTIQSLRSFLEMLLLQMFFLVFFSISAFYLFSSILNYEQFSTIWNSFISLFVLLTTSNFPDVMMPAYKEGQLYVIFFVFFLIVNLYFLLNIMLAVVYNAFSQIEKDKFRKLLLHRRIACEHAFRLLVTRGSIDCIRFEHFCGLLNYLKPGTSLLERYLMFKALVREDFNFDRSNSRGNSPTASSSPARVDEYLTLEKFYHVYEVLHLRWRDETVNVPWFENVPCLCAFRSVLNRIHALVTHRWFNHLVYSIILLATAYQLLDAIFGYERWKEKVGLPTSATTVCAIFIGLYTVEMCLKLLALGPREYLRHRWNCFDCAITVISLATFLLAQYEVTTSLSTSFFSFRALRLIDLLRHNVKRYRDILGPFAFIIIKRFTSVTLVVLIVYYFFAIVAMECFGGYELRDCCANTSIETYYVSTGPGQYYYYLNNFNDVITSYVTLFELMVVNNWPIIMKAYVIITGTQLTSIFFMIFFMISLLVITVVIAFVIDTIQFQIQYKHRFGQDTTLNAKIELKVRLSNEEVRQICLIENVDHTDGATGSNVSAFTRRLLSSPFPPSWSLLKVIFRGQNFERLITPSQLHSTTLSRVPSVLTTTTTGPDSINMSHDELVQTPAEPGSLLFRGTRYRDKFSYNIRMYSDEIQKWIQ